MTNKSLDNTWAMLRKHLKITASKFTPLSQPKKNSKTDDNHIVIDSHFDWVLYCMLHDDLRDHDILDEKKAALHFVKHGKKEGRVASISDLFKRYGLEKITLPYNFSLEQFAKLNELELSAA